MCFYSFFHDNEAESGGPSHQLNLLIFFVYLLYVHPIPQKKHPERIFIFERIAMNLVFWPFWAVRMSIQKSVFINIF